MLTLSAADMLAISGAVVSLVEMIKWAGVPPRFGMLLAALLSPSGVILYAWSRLGVRFERGDWWELFSASVAVLLVAGGVYGFVRQARGGDVTSTKPKE